MYNFPINRKGGVMMTMCMTQNQVSLSSLCASVFQAARYYFSASFFYFYYYYYRCQNPA